MSIDKIGMYKTDEILEFMTEGEGRGFLGRSMFDAMYFEIERLHSIIKEHLEYKKYLNNVYNDKTMLEKVLEILGSDEE